MIREPITASEIGRDVRSALGREPVDLLLRNCRIVNVYSNEIHEADIAIVQGRIVAIRENFSGPATERIDAAGSYAAPALIDSIFVESGDPVLPAFPRGTGVALRATDYASRTLRDHEIVATIDEARKAVREGKTAFLDEKVGAEALASLLAELRRAGIDCSRIGFAVDPQKPAAGESHPIRLAVRSGFSVPEAFQMGALHPATHFGVDDVIGSLVPGRRADVLLFDHPDNFHPARMILRGREVNPP